MVSLSTKAQVMNGFLLQKDASVDTWPCLNCGRLITTDDDIPWHVRCRCSNRKKAETGKVSA